MGNSCSRDVDGEKPRRYSAPSKQTSDSDIIKHELPLQRRSGERVPPLAGLHPEHAQTGVARAGAVGDVGASALHSYAVSDKAHGYTPRSLVIDHQDVSGIVHAASSSVSPSPAPESEAHR